jgi:dipeptidyl aminopeptidase/acylaminoacyl peptidase
MSLGAAAVDKRIVAVSAIVATPDWRRPGSYQPQGEADPLSQADLDRRNPIQHQSAFRHRPAIAFQSGAKDMRVPAEAAERFVAALKPMYGKDADRLRVNLYDVGHGFVPAMWESTLQWFHKYLP